MADEAKNRTLAMREVVREASTLAEKRKELENLRSDDVREWSLNHEYYRNNQWVFWNSTSRQIETLGVDDSEKPRYKVRLTANEITPGVQQLVAQMTKTRPTIHAVPSSGADRDVKAAQMAERLYEFWWDEFALGSKLQSALTHAQISQGYWLIDWDDLAGSAMRVMLNPETGQPMTDEQLADVFREELREQEQAFGLPPGSLLDMFEKTVYVGDIRIQVLDGFQVWIDPSVQTFEDAQYAICKIPLAVDEIEARFGKRVEPDASTATRRPILMGTRVKDDRPKNVRDVFFLYHRPGPTMPKGKYVVWIEGPNEILAQSDWAYPFTELPLVKFPGIERPGSVMDEPRITFARPVQKELNNKVSKVAMHMNLTMKPQMIAPVGSLRQRLTDEPGAVFEYAPIQGLQPEWRPIPSIPAHSFEYIAQLQARLGRIFNQMPTERSQLPARTDSGELVELVQEAVADQISPEILRMEQALARAGDLMAALAQERYTEPRLMHVKGPGGSVQAKKFLNADLKGGFSYQTEAGSGLPRTRAGKIQQVKEMIEMGAITPQEALPYLPVAGLKTIQARLAADEDFAYRKIEKLVKGEPLNIPALQQALGAVQSGMNPQTGEFFQSPEEAISFVEAAALSPFPFENLQVSAFVLSQHMKSVEFEKYPPDVQSRFDQHFGMISQQLAGQQVVAEPIKANLSLKGTVGPTVAAAILRQNGVQEATPETMAEPPLETSVYDSVDKPDADEAGNDPLTQAEQMMSMMQAEETHQLKTAKASHELAKADAEAARAEEDADIARSRDEEIHQERLRQMRQPKPAAKE